MTIVDKVAAAIVRNDRNYYGWHFPGDEPRQWESPGGAYLRTTEISSATAENMRNQARAAMAAMREPTEAMMQVFADLTGIDDDGEAYRAMIDAALKEGKE